MQPAEDRSSEIQDKSEESPGHNTEKFNGKYRKSRDRKIDEKFPAYASINSKGTDKRK